MKEKATLTEIAARAGVSIATVSRIINNNGPVSAATREKVTQAIRDLNYDFALKQSVPALQSILVLLPDVMNPFYACIIDGIQQTAHNNGFEVFLMPTGDIYPSASYLVSLIKKNDFAGVLWLSSTPPTDLLSVIEHHCPIVMCCEYPEDQEYSFVSIHDVTAAHKAVSYLLSTGCRKIGMVNCSLKYRYARHRRAGFQQALKEAGLESNADWYVSIPTIDYTLAYSAVLQTLHAENIPDAFFCCSDVYAAATINAAQSLGLRVPEDLSVIGFDNVETSRMTRPAITTIAQPCLQLGQQACAILVEKITTPQIADRHILLNTELIIRGSTR